MNNEHDHDITRWTAEPYAWLVFGIPAATVAACAIMIAIAVVTRDGLVVDDYYKQGLAINRVLAREAAAADRGLVLTDFSVAPDGAYRFKLSAAKATAPPENTLRILFTHATRARADQQSIAQINPERVFEGRVGKLARGPWYADISTPEWRLVHRFTIN